MPVETLADIDRRAALLRVSRSEYVRRACLTPAQVEREIELARQFEATRLRTE